VLNPNGTDITSVCGSAEAGSNALAYPGRRFVKAAKGLATAGGGVVLRSICDDDYAAVIDALVERIAGQLTGC